MPTWRRGGFAAAPSNPRLRRCPRQESNLRTRVGVACDADLEAGRLCRRAVLSPLKEMPPPRIELAHARRRRLRCRLGGGAALPPRRLIPAYGDAPAKNRTCARASASLAMPTWARGGFAAAPSNPRLQSAPAKNRTWARGLGH